MSTRSKRHARRRSISADILPPEALLQTKPLQSLPEVAEPPVEPSPSESTPVQVKHSIITRPFIAFWRALMLVFSAIASIIIQILSLPLLPIRHLKAKTYLTRVSTGEVKNLKKELRALERELEKAKRRPSIISVPCTPIIAPAPVVAPLPPPPPPPKMLPPPPPPPPPFGLPKAPLTKTWRTSSDAAGANKIGAATSKPAIKPAIAKKGFDISADQIANIAARLRKSSSSSAPPLKAAEPKQPSPNNLTATLRAQMKTRRSSLLQLDGDRENKPNAIDEASSADKSSATTTSFRTGLRKAPILRSPGGTPYKQPVQSKPILPFNTALADKNITASPPKSEQFN